MATWKKIITSGSSAELSSLTLDTALPVAQGGTGVTSLTDGGILLGSGTNGITATAVLTDGQILVGDGSGDPVAESGATLRTSIGVGTGDSPQFTGLTLSGDLTVQGGDITLTNGATDIDLIDNNASALSFDASGKAGILEIDTTNNSERVKMSKDLLVTGNISGSAASTGSFGLLQVEGGDFTSASLAAAIASDGDITGVDITAGTGIDISGEVNTTSGNYAATMSVDVSDFMSAGANNRIVTATGTDGQNAEANLTFDGSTLTLTGDAVFSGDLTINGTTTTIATTNTLVEDKFMFLGTGSAASNKDIGILAQSGSADLTGSAFYHDTDDERWSVAKSVSAVAETVTPLHFVTTVKLDDSNPSSTTGEFGAGEMLVNTASGDIWIRFG